MKLYQKVLWLACFLGVWGWAANSAAAPIPYTFTWYTAHAETTYVSEMSFFDPPVVAGSVDYYSFFGPTQAVAEAPDSSHFSASSFSVSGDANSFLHATFGFTSTFPAIRIQYDVILSAWAAIIEFGFPSSFASAEAEINSFLRDTTAGLTIWSDDQIVSASAVGNEPPFVFGNNPGSIDVILALTPGHEYELFLSCSSKAYGESGIIFYSEGSGSAELTNILVDAVPIPSTILLFSTGLIGLWEFRKRFAG